VNSVGDALSYPFKDPAWLGKIAVQALILIIPIVGAIALIGWMMITLDNIRAGRQELAPAGFHISRGIGMFGVELIYYLVAYIPYIVLAVLGAIVGHDNAGAGAPLLALGYLYQTLASLFIAFLLPAMYVMTYHHGFSGGMNVGSVWRLATTNLGNSFIAALMMIVAGIIASIGIIACFIGVFFTAAYAGAVIIGIVAWYERVQSAPAVPAA
jgi:hypothetical protein